MGLIMAGGFINVMDLPLQASVRFEGASVGSILYRANYGTGHMNNEDFFHPAG
jgi:hypothetical protein